MDREPDDEGAEAHHNLTKHLAHSTVRRRILNEVELALRKIKIGVYRVRIPATLLFPVRDYKSFHRRERACGAPSVLVRYERLYIVGYNRHRPTPKAMSAPHGD